ncbi:permease, partial [Candidatus Aerophobetes bacterium]|nr:permease [Candidatus Aerophobetes bacterium]
HGVILGAAIGVPMYTPTLVEVFLVKALLNLGMSPAAAIAFLISAPMASVPSMLGVSRLINWRCVLNYAILAIVVGIIAGFIYMGAIKTL